MEDNRSLIRHRHESPGEHRLSYVIVVARQRLFDLNNPRQKVMANVGIEPKTFALLARRSNQLS